MARKVVPRPYEAVSTYPTFEDDQEDSIYTDPHRDTVRAAATPHKSQQSYPPSGQFPSLNSGPLSDKENAPEPPRQRGSNTSPLVKKERGLIAKSARSAPYEIPPEPMPPRKSKTPASSSRPLTERSNITGVSKRAGSKSSLRVTSAASSITSSRSPSVVPESPVTENGHEEDERDEEEETNDEEDEEEEEEEGAPESTQQSRVSETPAPSRTSRRTPAPTQIPTASQFPSSQRPGSQFYDPNQSMAERRMVKGAYNTIQQDLADNKNALMQTGNAGLLEYIEKTNELFNSVKQTSDAMVDGKVQVEIGRIAAEKAKRVGNSSTNTGLDVDEFIAKCIQFMSKSKPGDASDGHDWAYLGREVATPAMRTAKTSDFMYGPMGVQKRQRVIKERKKAVRRRPEEFIRPIDLDEKQIARNENSTTKNVVTIKTSLKEYFERTGEDVINYFEFVINPESYSQTIENMFYLAFLVKDGRVAILESEDGLLYLADADPPTPEEIEKENISRKQIVMPMEKHIWRELIEVFDIRKSIIPTRPREVEAINVSGWYS
ncbi:nuclear protein [Orbilia oligospora]|uniref:Non-structural maintenance of chromosomes element 4 n=1 Tax=Orbilia oligospora TaxID=2813651 RepID=A0A7C8N4L6_ORBOL|nr:nuclear protein [Orbilia oligospora]KAF3089690.1 nuclear protein [Orbilia oligospora]KAF3108781.1 nuclear protein [Orbilia oligospora]KAF3121165.1 nuclear protein [Orbilia oligospora]KAF3126300.1 nuclear protein [Orbilia oligospora]